MGMQGKIEPGLPPVRVDHDPAETRDWTGAFEAVSGHAGRGRAKFLLERLEETAKELGVPIGDHLRAMLDAQSVSFSGGTISLHDDAGVPLSGLGAGSARPALPGRG